MESLWDRRLRDLKMGNEMLETSYFSNVKALMLGCIGAYLAFDLNIFISSLEVHVHQVGE